MDEYAEKNAKFVAAIKGGQSAFCYTEFLEECDEGKCCVGGHYYDLIAFADPADGHLEVIPWPVLEGLWDGNIHKFPRRPKLELEDLKHEYALCHERFTPFDDGLGVVRMECARTTTGCKALAPVGDYSWAFDQGLYFSELRKAERAFLEKHPSEIGCNCPREENGGLRYDTCTRNTSWAVDARGVFTAKACREGISLSVRHPIIYLLAGGQDYPGFVGKFYEIPRAYERILLLLVGGSALHFLDPERDLQKEEADYLEEQRLDAAEAEFLEKEQQRQIASDEQRASEIALMYENR